MHSFYSYPTSIMTSFLLNNYLLIIFYNYKYLIIFLYINNIIFSENNYLTISKVIYKILINLNLDKSTLYFII